MAVRTPPRKTSRKHAPKRVNGRSLKRNAKRKRASRRGPIRRWLRKWWWAYLPPLVIGLAGAGLLVYLYVTIPLPPDRVLQQTTFLFDRQGERLTALSGEQDRTVVPLDRIPKHVQQAVLAAEDARFYSHPGVSILDIIRAGWADLRDQSITQGASTITQQLVRNVFPEVGTERTIERKVKEAILALKLERQLDKKEILERYLNTIYLGDGTYGFQAASMHYFGKPVGGINVLQAATLAGTVARPEGFNPRRHPVDARIRRNYVLDRMAELGFIAGETADRLRDKPVTTKPVAEGYADDPSAWFIDYTRQWLTHNKLSPLDDPERQTFEGGLRVQTTVDQRWQRAAIQAIQSRYSYEGAPDAALVAIDPNNGEIRAIASSLDYSSNPKKRLFHPATFGCDLTGCPSAGGTGRQTGSSFKAFTVAGFIEEGYSLNSTFSGASPVLLDEPPCGSEAEPWDPENFGGSGYGVMDIRGATQSSVNTIFAQMISLTGPGPVVDVAHRLGIRSTIPEFCSITLGAVEVNVLEMTSAYATLANGGIRHNPTPVSLIRTADGPVWKNKNNGNRVMKADDAWLTVDALEGVMFGTGSSAYFGVPSFGKTGSEDNATDAWFCGGTTELVACVWVGHHASQEPIPGLTGGGNAAPVWHDFMVVAHQDLDPQAFPDGSDSGEIAERQVPLPPPPEPEPTKEPEEEEEEEDKPPPKPKPDPKPSEEPTEPPEPPDSDRGG